MFGSIDSVDWISKIELSEAREHQIRESFCYASVEFRYPNEVEEFETILELLKDNKSDVNININAEVDDLGIGEKDVFDRLIVMDDVSGLAEKSNEFCSFLTVSRKCRYSCIYIFHIVFSQLRNWQMILSQTKIFNIFPSAVQLGNISKLLTNNCDRETFKYIPKCELWINRLYFEIANRKDYSCLTTDCGKSGPSKYRIEADNTVRQTCFFSQKKKDRVFDRFTSHNLEPDNRDSLIFKIELSDKNSIKERHLPCTLSSLAKSSYDSRDNNDGRSNDRRNFQGKSAENEPINKKWSGRNGAKSRKRPRFLVS